ncbi:Panacea domain-containing protein [Lactococcus lactis]|uniref:DUF4065 domain-containing protein n=1 Tax=Lactococcus lactis TaxID=1358 RepID=A0AAW8UD63_9LACT|nr:type II toxin-antitoxin system antitoxin SocA domain-containing protein [Lactococcus lactis]MDT2861306.1 DUF4065 domain-containing protein [Lactococcus lactis]MDT2870682.1 DUF4065 domain-containing protein [Lactococcus lactis]MDT2882141.1 DUF4065 domain-containing protein [Lactococcus lactis]MDT2889544.1 DUF4065 domain-containing protein [Lactococcus lactis]MDT2892247.1 DUF4065 domain-containing protein [Lactococcus lactis]
MFHHIILITSSYILGKRIGWHYSSEDLELSLLEEVQEKSKDSMGALHQLTTEDSSWESVVKKDSFFKDVKLYPELDEYLKAVEESRKISALDIAKFLLSVKPMSNLKLQKMVYLVYADYLVKTGKPLFDEKILAYKFGPVVKEVYDEYKPHGREEIVEDDSEEIKFGVITYPMVLARFIQAEDGSEIIASIKRTLKVFGDKSASKLVDLTHREGGPWDKTEQSMAISDDLIRKYHCVELTT